MGMLMAPTAHSPRTADAQNADMLTTCVACEQVSTKLKLGVMWDHNGTYMEGFGFQYRDQQVIVELDAMDEITGTQHRMPLGYLSLYMICHHVSK